MGLLRKAVIGLAAFEGINYLRRFDDRKKMFARAKADASARGKPLLVVGSIRAWYQIVQRDLEGFGEVPIRVCDLNPTSPSEERCDVQRLPYADKQFGAVYCGYVLEYVEDIAAGIRELHRVADAVYIVHMQPWEPGAWTLPGSKWVIQKAPPVGEWKYIRQPLFDGTVGMLAATVAAWRK